VRITFKETVALVDGGRAVRLHDTRNGFGGAESDWSIVRSFQGWICNYCNATRMTKNMLILGFFNVM